MKNYLLALAIVLGANFRTHSQLPDGSIAPDFTLSDRDGNIHNLYTYLNEGKVVFIKFFACHCPSCWAYHNTGKLESLYQTYGPSGTDQIIVLMLEHDINNPDAFVGLGGYTQGNWEIHNSIPMVDVEGMDRSIFDDYNMNYYPMIMKVCSDKTTELMSTTYLGEDLFQEANNCPGSLGIKDVEETGFVYYDPIHLQFVLNGFKEVMNISIYNLTGQKALNLHGNSNSIVDVSSLSKGIYLLRLEHAKGIFSEKILIQ